MVLSMKNEIKIAVRAYNVQIRDERTGEKSTDTIVLTKDQLRAGAMFNLSDEDIIYRTYNRQGFRVLAIGQARKREISVDVTALFLVRAELIAQMAREAVSDSE